MSQLQRRSFLKASAGLALAAGSTARADLPIPPATGRLYKDAAARRTELYALLGKVPDRQRPIQAEKLTRSSATATSSRPGSSI